MEHYNFSIHVYYLAESRYSGYADLYTVAEKLLEVFTERLFLNVDESVIKCVTVEEQTIEMSRADMGVHFSGKIDFVNPYKDTDEAEFMEELNVEI